MVTEAFYYRSTVSAQILYQKQERKRDVVRSLANQKSLPNRAAAARTVLLVGSHL